MAKISVFKFLKNIDVKEDFATVPYSELAMHVGAAGMPIKEIHIISNRWARVVYFNNRTNKIDELEGLITEVTAVDISKEIQKALDESEDFKII